MMTTLPKAILKYMLSYLKRDWELQDYPIRFWHQSPPDDYDVSDNWVFFPWHAQIINWGEICGFGNTKGEAYSDLVKIFSELKSELKIEGRTLPRPGTRPPLVFASAAEVEKLDSIATDFFDKILDLNYAECFISDQSNLSDFDNIDILVKRIYEVYKVDVSDVEYGNLVEVFGRINQKQQGEANLKLRP